EWGSHRGPVVLPPEGFLAPVARNLPPASLPSAPRRSLCLVLPGAHSLLPQPRNLSNWLFFFALPCCSPLPSGPLLLIPCCLPLPLPRLGDCRCAANRRLLDYLQPQLACLPPQRLDLLLLHLRLVLLLILTHVRYPVLQRQVDDPCQLVRRRGQRRLTPQ